jgi:transposase
MRAWLVLEDESGYSLVSPLRSSWAPRGKTPSLHTRLTHHQRLNLLGALAISPNGRRLKLSVQSYRQSLRGEQVILFLKQLMRRLPGQIVLVWDNHPIHQRRLVEDFISAQPRLLVYRFPVCAPELNPVEFVWAQISAHTANYAPHNLVELSSRVEVAIARIRNSQKRLVACFLGTHLSWI